MYVYIYIYIYTAFFRVPWLMISQISARSPGGVVMTWCFMMLLFRMVHGSMPHATQGATRHPSLSLFLVDDKIIMVKRLYKQQYTIDKSYKSNICIPLSLSLSLSPALSLSLSLSVSLCTSFWPPRSRWSWHCPISAGEAVVPLRFRELQLQIVAWLLWIFIVTILSLPSILFAVAQAPDSARSAGNIDCRRCLCDVS